MALIETLKWDGAPNVFAYRYPNCELTTKSQVVVYESQEAVFVKDGQFFEPLGPGRHVLDAKNFPFLTQLVTNLVTGGESPFSAEVWFVNKAIPLDIKWGTAEPIQVEDPKYHVMMPVRAFGQYGLQIADTQRFLASLVGRVPVFVTKTLSAYFKGIVTTSVKDCIATYIVNEAVSVLQMGSRLAEVSSFLQEELTKELQDYGVRVASFKVISITADESDPAVAQLKRALAKKAEMEIVGYTYQQEKSFDVMSRAAGNEGGGAGASVMQTGLGLGMGLGLGGPLGGAAAGLATHLQLDGGEKAVCGACGAALPAAARFCPNCGAARMPPREGGRRCERCGVEWAKPSRFCPNCGHELTPLPEKRTCPACQAELPPAAKFCPNCGKEA